MSTRAMVALLFLLAFPWPARGQGAGDDKAPASEAPTRERAVRSEAAVADEAAGLKSSFVGLVIQPVACLSKCDGSLLTIGGEMGATWFGFAMRYGHGEHSHTLLPDIRLFFDLPLARRISVTPLLDITPGFVLIVPPDDSDKILSFEMMLRPGVRLNVGLSGSTSLFVEPLAIELTLYSRFLSGAEGSSTSTILRYNAAAGIQYRH